MNNQATLECVEPSAHVTMYNPALLFDALIQKLELPNDRALAEFIGVTPSVISKIRTHRTPVSAAILIRVNEMTNVAISDIRAIIGERRTKLFYSEHSFNRGRRAGD
jgi:DNA-binding transcriptional regulator YdaS (Cro superfamily)